MRISTMLGAVQMHLNPSALLMPCGSRTNGETPCPNEDGYLAFKTASDDSHKWQQKQKQHLLHRSSSTMHKNMRMQSLKRMTTRFCEGSSVIRQVANTHTVLLHKLILVLSVPM